MNRTSLLRCAELAALVCAATAGCGKSAPDGMPETVPFSVKVVDGSKGIADVQVVMDSEAGVGAVSGTTNSSGVAEMKTTFKNFTAKGVPVGDYKVRCIKNPTVDHWKTEEELNKMDLGERQAYFDEWQKKNEALDREVPKILEDFDNCPCKTTVSGEGEFVVDVAEYKEK